MTGFPKTVALLIASMATVLLLAGCQTTKPELGGFRVSHKSYTAQFDQGDHLRDLLDNDEYVDALWLFEEQKEFFNRPRNRTTYRAELMEIAAHYNTPRRKPADKMIAKLKGVKWPSPQEEWLEIRKIIADANLLIGDYPSEFLLNDPEFGLASLRNVKILLGQLETTLAEGIQQAFDTYAHFKRETFVLLYPLTMVTDKSAKDLDSASFQVLKDRFPHFRHGALIGNLSQASMSDLMTFAERYPGSTFFPEDIAKAYVSRYEALQQKRPRREDEASSFAEIKTVATIARNDYLRKNLPAGPTLYIVNAKPHLDPASEPREFLVAVKQDFGLSKYGDGGTAEKGKSLEGALAALASAKPRLALILGSPIGTVAEIIVQLTTISSERPVKTERSPNPEWPKAKEALELAGIKFQEVGGDEEAAKLPFRADLSNQPNGCESRMAVMSAAWFVEFRQRLPWLLHVD